MPRSQGVCGFRTPEYGSYFRVVKDGLSPQEFNLSYANLEPKSFQTYVANSYSSSTPEGNVNYRPNNPNIKSILKYFSSTEALVGIFQYSILNEEKLLLLMDLANGHSGNTELVEIIYAKMVNLQTLFRSYDFEVLLLNHLRSPHCVCVTDVVY